MFEHGGAADSTLEVMIKMVRRTIKWIAITIAVVIVIVLLILGILTTPGPFYPEEKQYGAITVHAESPIGPQIDSMMAEVFTRLQAVPIYDPNRRVNLCLSTQEKFSFFARLTWRRSRTMGFCLLGHCYVNIDFINELAVKTGGRPKYNTREGSIVHVATHELIHQYLADAYGDIASRFLPTWKTEGYCEYGANHFVAPRDCGYSLPERVDIFLDDSQWNPTATTHRPHYLWGLMVEYLADVKDLSFEQIMDEDVTKDVVYQEMMAWRRSLGPSVTKQLN
jgi:hypothetical protein